MEEFELFMQMKLFNSLQQRHIKDHIDLTQLQIKLLDNLEMLKQAGYQHRNTSNS